MKATLSRDMKHRTNLRIDYRLDKAQVVGLLAVYAATYGESGVRLTEKMVMEMVKKQLMYQGLDVLEFGANVEVDDETLAWAHEQVGRFWKEEL